MAILDERTEFADATPLLLTGTGLLLLGDVIDLGVARDIGAGKPGLTLVITVDTPITSGGAANVGFVLASDAQPAIAVDGSASVHARTTKPAKASLVAGFKWAIGIPPEGDTPYERYLGILQDVDTTVLTAGKVNAYLTLDNNAWKAYPDGV